MRFDSIGTTAFGRRGVTRAQILAQLAVKAAVEASAEAGQGASQEGSRDRGGGAGAAHKWTLLRTLGEIREGLGVSDRTLGVLSALLSFHPETALTLGHEPVAARGAAQAAAGLIVFPSNKALSLRCNGMSEATLRRHLAALVEAGLILRRDSPNGKRFARRAGAAGVREAEQGAQGLEAPAQAYGFDLAPLAARAGEFEARRMALRAEQTRLRLLKERVTLLRRDLTKRLAFAREEGLAGAWEELRRRVEALGAPLRRLRTAAELTALAAGLEQAQAEIDAALEAALTAHAPRRAQTPTNDDGAGLIENLHGDDAHFGRRHTESKPNQLTDIEPASNEAGADQRARPAIRALAAETQSSSDDGASPPLRSAGGQGLDRDLPLALVLRACPDIADYASPGRALDGWPAFLDLAETVRPMLGVSPDAWRAAQAALGDRAAAAALAFILQRGEHSSQARSHRAADGRVVVTVDGAPAIRSPGGYLRALAQKAERQPVSLWPPLLALLARRAGAAREDRD